MVIMMGQTTTIPIDPKVRDRLRAFGKAGMTYSDILTAVMDQIEMEKFFRETEALLKDPNVKWVDHDDIQWD
jgi:hypothetical protein